MSYGVEGSDYATHLIELARALNQRRHTVVSSASDGASVQS